MGQRLLVQHGVGEGLLEERREMGLREAEVEQAQVVTGPSGGVGGHAEALGDTAGDRRPDVAEHPVEIETAQHDDEVTDGL